MVKPAIVAVGYNRPQCLKRLLTSIGDAYYECSDIPLIISIDKSDKIDEVANVAKDFNWVYGEKTILTAEERLGLKNHIIKCGDLSETYGAVIILEDDIFVSTAFYVYTQRALDFYKDDDRIVGPALYSFMKNPYVNYSFIPEASCFDNYFAQFVITWGQCWKKKHWKQFKKWYAQNETLPSENHLLPKEVLAWTRAWSKYFVSFMQENNLYYAVPYQSLSTNFSEKGEHQSEGGYDTAYQVPILPMPKEYSFADFDFGIKYDSFMERVFNCDEIAPSINGNDVCVDLYGTRVKVNGKKYLLTTRKFDFSLVKTFGLRMHPIDSNITFNVDGEGINLYEVKGNEILIRKRDCKPGIYKCDRNRLQYETFGMTWRQLFSISRKIFFDKLGEKVRNRIGGKRK